MKRGISLYFVTVILGILTAVLLFLVNIIISQIKIIFTTNESMIAFYAADSGAERILYEIKQGGIITTGECSLSENSYHFTETLDNEAVYKVCIPNERLIYSLGIYRKAQRKIELRPGN